MMASLYQSRSLRSKRGAGPAIDATWVSNRVTSARWTALATRASLRREEPPDHVWAILGVQPHVLNLAGPCEAPADDEVLRFNGGLIRQPEFPERNLKMRAMGR